MVFKAENIFDLLRTKKKIILVLLLWIGVISTVLIKTFFLARQQAAVPRPLPSTKNAPVLGVFDMATLMIASILIAAMLADAKEIIYSYFICVLSSFVIAVAYDSLYIWSTFTFYQEIPFGWENACFWALLNVFRAVFPLGTIVILFGAIVGGVLKDYGR